MSVAIDVAATSKGQLWTGRVLSGIAALFLRVGAPLFSTLLFPIYVALFVWGGLYLRDPLLRSIIPAKR